VYPSDFSLRAEFETAEHTARENNVGVWNFDPDQTPTPIGSDTGLVISEIHADAEGNDNDNLNDEYLVLKNTASTSLELSGWQIRDEADHTYTFPDGFVLESGMDVTIHSGSGTNSESRLYWGASSAIWNNNGDTVFVYAADGDMRKAINALQAAAVMGETVDEDNVFTITATARPEEIEAMITEAIDGNFVAACDILDELLSGKGLAGGDLIDQLHRSVWEFDLEDDAAVRLLDRIGEADYRIAEGANERIQLEALLASVALEHEG
jgi:hypothetical protein